MNGARGLPPNLVIALLIVIGVLFLLGTLAISTLGHVVGLRIFAAFLMAVAYLGYLGMRLSQRRLRRLGLEYDRDRLEALQERATPEQQELLARLAALRWLATVCMVLAVGFYLVSLAG